MLYLDFLMVKYRRKENQRDNQKYLIQGFGNKFVDLKAELIYWPWASAKRGPPTIWTPSGPSVLYGKWVKMKYKVKKKKIRKQRNLFLKPFQLRSYPMFFSFFQADFLTKETQLAVRLYRYVRAQRVRFFSRFGHK